MKIKINSKYKLSQIKLNYNCPESEKVGSGPGSCSDNKSELMLSDLKLHPAKITSLGTSKFGSSGKMKFEKFNIQFPNASSNIAIRVPISDSKAAPRLARTLASIPPKLATTIKSFILTDQPDKTDTIASKQYGKSFTTAASFNPVSHSITFFGDNGYIASISRDILIHELVHSMDTKLGQISRSDEYKQAVELDTKLSKRSEFTSSYARDSYKVKPNDPLEEDMADGIPLYLKDKEKFSGRYPNRAKFYEKLLGD